MEDIWTRINNDVPMYMESICREYKLLCIKISPLKTALICKKYALIIEIDRFDSCLCYVYREEGNIMAYSCGNYFAQKYDEEDRVNLLNGNGANIMIRNDIIITANGLLNKWKNVLSGEREWLVDYKNSSRYSLIKLTKEERIVIDKYL